MSDTSISYHNVSVHPDRIIVTRAFEGFKTSHYSYSDSDSCSDDVVAVEKRKVVFSVNDELSRITKSKINRAVSYLNYIANDKIYHDRFTDKMIRYKLTFATLTLSSAQVHTDNEIKYRLINQFFTEAKKRWSVKHYIWRGEKQQNHNLHIHILLDKWIPYQELQDVWNRIQNKLGYVDRYADKMSQLTYKDYCDLYKSNSRYDDKKIKKAWIKGRMTNWKHPNSTDIHSLIFVKDITAYICKYLKKSEQNKGIEGRLWSASHSLCDLKGGRDIVTSDLSNEINAVAVMKGVRHVHDSYFDIFFVDAECLREAGCALLYGLLEQFLRDRFADPAIKTPPST